VCPNKSSLPAKSRSVVRAFVDQGEELVYIIVAGLLLVAIGSGPAATRPFTAVQTVFGAETLWKGFFSLVNDVLLVLIIMEVLRTVGTVSSASRELDVDVEDVVPFSRDRLLSLGRTTDFGDRS